MTRWRFQLGFTLLEVLVVVSVIGILAGIVAVNLSSARRLARDARRKQDAQEIQSALELYYNDTKAYPATSDLLVRSQTGQTYLTSLPLDPSTGQRYTYRSGGGLAVCADQWYEIEYKLEDTTDALFAQTRAHPVRACDGTSYQSDAPGPGNGGVIRVGASLP